MTNIALGEYKYQSGNNISLCWSLSQCLITRIMYCASYFDAYLSQAIVVCCD